MSNELCSRRADSFIMSLNSVDLSSSSSSFFFFFVVVVVVACL